MVNTDTKPQIFVLSGPPGAGKSTVGKLLAQGIKNSAVVSTDSLRHMILNGKAGIKDPNWMNQLKLGAKNASILANSFLANGFNVFLDDVICDEVIFEIYSNSLINPVFIALLPSKDVLTKRDSERGEEFALKERAIYLHGMVSEFIKNKNDFIVIDSSNQTAEETADEIIQTLNSKGTE